MKAAKLFAVLGIFGFVWIIGIRHPEAKSEVVSASSPIFKRAVAMAVSAPLSSLSKINKSKADPKVESRGFDQNIYDGRSIFGIDRTPLSNIFGTQPMPQPILSFDGLSDEDNVNAFGLLIIPPDANGDIGPNNYVQAVNALVRVYDRSCNAQTPPIALNTIFAPLGTACSQRIDGLPNILYDPLADRWLISQICSNFPPFKQLIAISKTGDPTGEFYLYEFIMPNVKNPDFPKYGVWPDAYYLSTNEFFGADYAGTGAFAFDSKKMLVGDPSAGYIYFAHAEPGPQRRGGLLPSDIDGLRPPAEGSPNIFAGYSATEYGDAQDAVRLFDFHADFNDPSLSTFSERSESPLPVAAFDPTSPDGRADIAQPTPGEFLDSQSDRPGFRLAYRNFGDHSSLVFNQTVRTTPVSQTYRAGIRVYELKDFGSGFSVTQQATLGDTIASRWIGSAAQDGSGNLAVGYNIGNENKKPSIVYSGRAASDPAGAFRSETTLIEGTGVQTGFGFRWGEYSGMSVDPADDCTFWMTGEYYTLASQTFSEFGWLTRIGTFKFPECTPSLPPKISGSVTNSMTGTPIANALITASAYSRNTNVQGIYGPMNVSPGTYNLTAAAHGFAPKTVQMNVAQNQTLTVDFALDPIAVIESHGIEITAENCDDDNAPEPGETLTIDLPLQNTGAAAANNLTAELLPSSAIIDPSSAQNYGTLPVNGTPVVRPFTFTVSPEVICGSMIDLVFRLRDGTAELGNVSIRIRVGSPKAAFAENFDGITAPNLPNGWTTSATGGQLPWATSTARATTPNNSVFSPDPIHVGLNEIVSPPIEIETTNAVLSFQNWYELESTFLRNRLFDGSVLEIAIGSGDWQDIIAAGGEFISGGYDGTIDGCCQNPLAGRQGWSGKSGTGQTPAFITTRVKLPANAAGNSIRLRWRIGTDIGTFREGQYIDDILVTDGFQCSCSINASNAPFDLDGDGRTDLSVYSFSDLPEQADFRYVNSSNGNVANVAWGSSGDVPTAADLDGDGKTDIAVFRPSTGVWYILKSSDSTAEIVRFGLAGDIPAPANYNANPAAEIAVYRPANGLWYVLDLSTWQTSIYSFGIAEDIPVPGDFDGDDIVDISVFRPSTGVWYVLKSTDGSVIQTRFGASGDIPISGDSDGDGRSDLTVFRPSDRTWYTLGSSAGFSATQFGLADDEPLQADIDGDGRRDIGVYRPSTGVWYFIGSQSGSVLISTFGTAGEHAVPGIYLRR